MSRPSTPAWLGLVALALLSYFQYPGHIYLESDTQIYLPMFERFRDPGLFERDPMVTRAHTAFTLYDECALWTARLTGLDFEAALGILHVLVRVTLLAGIFLVARAMGLSEPLGLAAAGVYALGGRVLGPAVLLVEYEPVPRAFALGPVLLGLGLVAHQRYLAAGAAATVGFLLHPTTAAPFWIVFAAMLFVPDEPAVMKRRLRAVLPLIAAIVLLRVAAGLQPGVTERQAFLGRVDEAWEQLIRMRASYVWVSQWPPLYFWQYGCMLLLNAAAYWKLRVFIQPALRFFLVGLCIVGVLSLPFSYLMLETLKWSMMPQAQPLRAILFVELFAVVAPLVMAFELACREGRWVAALWWASAGLAVGLQPRLLFLLAPLALAWLWDSRWRWAGAAVAVLVLWAQPFGMSVWRGAARRDLMITLALAAALVASAMLSVRYKAGIAAVAAAATAAFFVVPGAARFHWSGQPRNPELNELSRWARSESDRNAVFLFADAGRSLEPGAFRARSARALYVDWKGGGQINFFPRFSQVWWTRWQQTLAQPYRPDRVSAWGLLGVDYVVLSAKNRLADRQAVYENSRYVVYQLR
jgi:hypothetical protein